MPFDALDLLSAMQMHTLLELHALVIFVQGTAHPLHAVAWQTDAPIPENPEHVNRRTEMSTASTRHFVRSPLALTYHALHTEHGFRQTAAFRMRLVLSAGI